jgi:hypothetical protein
MQHAPFARYYDSGNDGWTAQMGQYVAPAAMEVVLVPAEGMAVTAAPVVARQNVMT